MEDRPLYAFFGHHKCGTTWINAIVIRLCRHLGLNFVNVSDPGMFGHDLPAFIRADSVEFLSFVNADIKYTAPLANCRGIHVIRDPRDIVVSGYFSHRYSHSPAGWPALEEHRARLESVTKDEGLCLEMEFESDNLARMASWDYAQPGILELKMEGLISDPYEAFVRITSHLGLLDEDSPDLRGGIEQSAGNHETFWRRLQHALRPQDRRPDKVSLGWLLTLVFSQRFSAMAGNRKRGEEDPKSHYRKGIAGDWKNHFTPRHVEYFEKRYGDLLSKLGYGDRSVTGDIRSPA